MGTNSDDNDDDVVFFDTADALTNERIKEIASSVIDSIDSNYIPTPFDESKDPDKFWNEDPCDDCLPRELGYITDCVYYSRGKEVPKIFMEWGSIASIMGVVKRDAWLSWGDETIYPNLYTMIVGPAGKVHKGTATRFVHNQIDYIDTEIMDLTDDQNILGRKKVNSFNGTVTPERLLTIMQPEKQRAKQFTLTYPDGSPMTYPDGEHVIYYPTSEITIVQDETSTFLDDSQSSKKLMGILLDLYDAPDSKSNNTQIRKKERLRNALVNFFGAINPNMLKDAFPQAARSNGFFSRCMLVYQGFSTDRFYPPRIVPNAPTKQELRKRLAWIAANTWGQWDVTPEAWEWLQLWYDKHRDDQDSSGMLSDMKSRLDVILLKVALAMRWQRYDRRDQLVHLEDVKAAAYLLQRTIEESMPIYRMILSDKANERWVKVEEIIKKYGQVNRDKLKLESRIPVDELDSILNALASAHTIGIYNQGVEKTRTSHKQDELYVWVPSRNTVINRDIPGGTVKEKLKVRFKNEKFDLGKAVEHEEKRYKEEST